MLIRVSIVFFRLESAGLGEEVLDVVRVVVGDLDGRIWETKVTREFDSGWGVGLTIIGFDDGIEICIDD